MNRSLKSMLKTAQIWKKWCKSEENWRFQWMKFRQMKFAKLSFTKWSLLNEVSPNKFFLVKKFRQKRKKKRIPSKRKKKNCQKKSFSKKRLKIWAKKHKPNSWRINLAKPNWSLARPMSYVAKPRGRCWLRRPLAV